MATDEEHLELIEEARERQPKDERDEDPGPSLVGWTELNNQLAEVIDMLAGNLQATVAAAGARPPKVPPASRPKTAHSSVRERRARKQYQSIVDMVEMAQQQASPPPTLDLPQ